MLAAAAFPPHLDTRANGGELVRAQSKSSGAVILACH